MPDEYIENSLLEIKSSSSDDDIREIIDRIYLEEFSDGYEDGINEVVDNDAPL